MIKNKIYTVLNIFLLWFIFHLSYGQGARYTGIYTNSPRIQYVDKSNFVIEGLEITNTAENCISLYNCENVIIRNNKLGPSPTGKGIYLYNCKNITIIDCTFENVQSGLVASISQGIKFEYNDLTNIVGPLKGGEKIGVMAQFIQVSGAGNSISYNVCENIPGKSQPEDIINLNQSNGTAQSPIMVKGNWIRGGGPSPSGGGINLGDMGGSYQVAEDNILVDVGQYGIGISGGNNMTLRNNKVYGSKKPFNNVGITVCNWYENLGSSYNITVANNEVNYIHKNGYLNNWWFANNVEPISGKETNVYKASMNASVLPAQIIGRARIKALNPIEDTSDSSIKIYKNKYDLISVNCPGDISPGATISVFNTNGQKIVTQSLRGYHSVVDVSLPNETYNVTVVNGKRTQTKKLTID